MEKFGKEISGVSYAEKPDMCIRMENGSIMPVLLYKIVKKLGLSFSYGICYNHTNDGMHFGLPFR